MENKIIEILNTDEKAKNLKRLFNRELDKHRETLTATQITNAVEMMTIILIKQNEEAMNLMAETAYNELRNK